MPCLMRWGRRSPIWPGASVRCSAERTAASARRRTLPAPCRRWMSRAWRRSPACPGRRACCWPRRSPRPPGRRHHGPGRARRAAGDGPGPGGGGGLAAAAGRRFRRRCRIGLWNTRGIPGGQRRWIGIRDGPAFPGVRWSGPLHPAALVRRRGSGRDGPRCRCQAGGVADGRGTGRHAHGAGRAAGRGRRSGGVCAAAGFRAVAEGSVRLAGNLRGPGRGSGPRRDAGPGRGTGLPAGPCDRLRRRQDGRRYAGGPAPPVGAGGGAQRPVRHRTRVGLCRDRRAPRENRALDRAGRAAAGAGCCATPGRQDAFHGLAAWHAGRGARACHRAPPPGPRSCAARGRRGPAGASGRRGPVHAHAGPRAGARSAAAGRRPGALPADPGTGAARTGGLRRGGPRRHRRAPGRHAVAGPGRGRAGRPGPPAGRCARAAGAGRAALRRPDHGAVARRGPCGGGRRHAAGPGRTGGPACRRRCAGAGARGSRGARYPRAGGRSRNRARGAQGDHRPRRRIEPPALEQRGPGGGGVAADHVVGQRHRERFLPARPDRRQGTARPAGRLRDRDAALRHGDRAGHPAPGGPAGGRRRLRGAGYRPRQGRRQRGHPALRQRACRHAWHIPAPAARRPARCGVAGRVLGAGGRAARRMPRRRALGRWVAAAAAPAAGVSRADREPHRPGRRRPAAPCAGRGRRGLGRPLGARLSGSVGGFAEAQRNITKHYADATGHMRVERSIEGHLDKAGAAVRVSAGFGTALASATAASGGVDLSLTALHAGAAAEHVFSGLSRRREAVLRGGTPAPALVRRNRIPERGRFPRGDGAAGRGLGRCRHRAAPAGRAAAGRAAACGADPQLRGALHGDARHAPAGRRLPLGPAALHTASGRPAGRGAGAGRPDRIPSGRTRPRCNPIRCAPTSAAWSSRRAASTWWCSGPAWRRPRRPTSTTGSTCRPGGRRRRLPARRGRGRTVTHPEIPAAPSRWCAFPAR